jgi:DNA-binding MarR family transcriptional regulator
MMMAIVDEFDTTGPESAEPAATGTETTVAPTTATGIREVEEQMSVLAGHIRASMRDTALTVDPALQPFGLKLLRLLVRCGPTQASAAAEALFVDRSAISRQARHLERLGLIELQVDPNDGRGRILAATPTAEERLINARANDKVLIHQRLASWSPDDLHRFAAYIARLNEAE